VLDLKPRKRTRDPYLLDGLEAGPVVDVDELNEDVWREVLHPRDRRGRWMHIVQAVEKADVDLKLAWQPGQADPANANRMEFRAKAVGAILDSGTEVQNAVLQLPQNTIWRKELLDKIATGPARDRAHKEYSETPVGDLEVLGGIEVSDKPIGGQAVCQMNTRVVKMGTTSVTGDFRHELGHAIRASMGGKGGYSAKTPLTMHVAQLNKESMAKAKGAMKSGIKPPDFHSKAEKEEWFETIYGIIGRRALDNWEEDFAEQYRGYHRAIFRTQHSEVPDHDPDALDKYRERFPGWARLWDAWYTAQLVGGQSD
jgi:hypothetical protein